MKKRLISLLLVFAMVLTMLPVTALAAPEDGNTSVNLANPFVDVKETDWFYDAVQYAHINGFFSGTSKTTFDPNGTMTRGMFVTVLAKMAGVDVSAYAGTSDFADVAEDAWYAPYVAWASKFGITSGTGDGKFSPDSLINREQMATFFVSYFEAFDVAYETGANITSTPADLDQVSSWAQDAVLKLWKQGLMTGDGKSFDPAGKASRTQAATLCMATDKAVDTWYSEPGVPSERVSIDPATGEVMTPETPATPSGGSSGGGGASSGDSSTTYYTVTFHMGDQTDSKAFTKGTLLSSMPIGAAPEGKVFIGWYKDEAGTDAVSGTDALTGNIDLYAKYADSMDLEENATPNFVSAIDQVTGFAVTLNGGATTDDFVLSDLTAPELTDGDASNGETVIVLSGGVVSATGGFEPGHTYQLELLDDSVTFDDSHAAFADLKATDRYDINKIRYFNFSIAKNGTLNLSLNEGIKYIAVGDLSEADGDKLLEYEGLYQVSTDAQGVATYTENNNTGTFTYNGNDIHVGDIVSVYAGTHPTQRNPEKSTARASQTDNDDIAYVKITAVDGNQYTYVAAEAEEVLFTPDILPVSVDANAAFNGSVTVPVSQLRFTSAEFAEMGLTAETTVDVGDFLAFYVGVLSDGTAVKAYGEITDVTAVDGNYVLTYQTVTADEVYASMDLYDETEASQAEMEEIVEESREEIEQAILMQLSETDFFDEAGEYLAGIALQTDEVVEVFGEGLTMDDVTVTYADGTPVGGDMSLMGNIIDSEGNGKRPNFSVSISPRLAHFEGAGTGVRAEVAVSYEFTIQKSGNKNKLTVELTAFFEQEIILGFTVSGGAVWKWKWGFIPYISDYRMSANLDLGTYTGLGITATAKLEQDEEPWGMPWPKDATDAHNQKEIFQLSESIKKKMKEVEKVLPEDQAGASGGLAEKYADFMEDANEEWVDLVSAKILDMNGNVDPLHILAYGLSIEFVVSANLNVALGMTFYYENYKRHSFTLTIKGKTAKTETVDLSANGYQFDFYVMGMIGIRAGVRVKATVGLISTKLAGVGLQIEAGAYAQLWGYFYYHLENWKVNGTWQKESGWSGALLIEIGVYLDINFVAEALNGKYAWKPSIYSNQWPFLTIGEQENVYDFAYTETESPTFDLYNDTPYVLPSSLYDMKWMDMKTGELEDDGEPNVKNYDEVFKGYFEDEATGLTDEKRFAIEMSNPNFKYEPHGNILIVENPDYLAKQDCVMTITWKGAPLTGSSDVLQREIALNWQTTELSTVAFETNGGSFANSTTLVAGDALTSALPAVVPTRAGYTFAGWYEDATFTNPVESGDTIGGQTAVTLYAKWTANTNTPFTVKHYQQQLDGSYKLTDTEKQYGTTDQLSNAQAKSYSGFSVKNIGNKNIAGDGSVIVEIYYDRNTYTLTFDFGYGEMETEITAVYGAAITAPVPARTGYTFNAWSAAIPETMPAGNQTITASWLPRTDTIYFVKHYQEQLGGTYKLMPANTVSDIGTTDTDTDAKAVTYTGFVTPDVTQLNINGDGSTVVNIYYDRERYTVTYDSKGGSPVAAQGSIPYGGKADEPEVPTLTGWTFDGWFEDETFQKRWIFENDTVDGPTTLYAKWNINRPTITFNSNGGSTVSSIVQDYNTAVTKPADPTKTGHTFAGWYSDEDLTQEYTFTTMPAQALTLYAKWTVNQYTVKFDANGGSGSMENLSCTYGEAKTLPENSFTHAGRTFAGWNTQKNGQGASYANGAEVTNLTDLANGEVTLYAQWSADAYTISYDLDGGKLADGVTNPGSYDVDTADITLNNPIKTGYTFAGWTGTDLNEATETVTIPNGSTGNRVYTATWTVNQTSIIFDTDGGSEIEPIVQNYGTAVTAPEDPAKTGYTFAGWDTEIPETMPAETVTIKALWTAITYTVTFNTDGGTLDGEFAENYSVSATYDAFYPTLPTASKTGWTFAGWYDGETLIGTGDKVQITADTQLTAKWDAGEGYNISYQLNGGTVTGGTNPVSYKVNSADITLINPTKAGYTFTGWTGTGLDNLTMTVTIPTGSTGIREYTANWSINQYTITFANTGDSSIAAITQDYGTAVTTPADPEKEGYTFTGWDKTIPTTMPAENVTITANWEINQYTITFANTGDSSIAAITQDYGTAVTPPADPTWAGHAFVSWDKTIPATMPAENMTITAQWTANSHTLTVNYGYDNQSSSEQVDFGTAINLETPERTGYTFAGWTWNTGDACTTMPDTDVTVTATWEINQYTITFVTGEGANSIPAITQDYGSEVTAPEDPTREGYTFDGWDVEIPAKMPAQNMSITAKWIANNYTITFDSDGGSAVAPITQAFGSGITAPDDPTKTGYTFAGWSPALPETMPAENQTHKALWTINGYTVKFDGNGATSGQMADMAFDYGTYLNLTKNAFARTGYTFQGWSTDKNGAVLYTDEEAVQNLTSEAGGIVTLYAVWLGDPVQYTLNANGGELEDDAATATVNAHYGDQIEKPADPTRYGHTFKGWYTDAACTEAWNFETTLTGDVTLYAKWEVTQYKINYVTTVNINGENVEYATTKLDPQTYDYDDGTVTLATPAFDATKVTFAGWYESADYAGNAVTEISADALADKTYYAKWTCTININYGIEGTLTAIGVAYTGQGEQVKSIEAVVGQSVELPQLTENMYVGGQYRLVPQHWSDDDGVTEVGLDTDGHSSVTAVGNTTYKAYWEYIGRTYRLTWDLQGGTAVDADGNPITLASGGGYSTQFEMPADVTWEPTNDGDTTYSLTKWTMTHDGVASDVSKEITTTSVKDLKDMSQSWVDEITFTAEKSSTTRGYTVFFDSNRGGLYSDPMLTQYFRYSEEKALSLNTFTRDGYTFAGWATTKQGDVMYTDGQTVSGQMLGMPSTGYSEVVLYAKWEPITYTVKFYANDGSGAMSEETMKYTSGFTQGYCPFTRDGYSFVGWATSANGEVVYQNSYLMQLTTIPNDVVELYAVWSVSES